MGFLVGIQLARGLGVAGYGSYGSAMAAASLGAIVASGGVQLHATREIAKYRAHGNVVEASDLLKWSLRTVLSISTTMALVVGAYVLWGQRTSLEVAFAAMALTVLTACLALTGAIVRGSGSLVLGQALNVVVRPTVQSVLLLVGVLSFVNISPAMALTIACISVLLAMFPGFGVVSGLWKGGFPQAVPTKDERKAWRRASGIMGLTTIVRTTEALLPLIIIGALVSLEQAGLFRVASSAMILTNMANTMLTIMVPALVVRIYADKDLARLQTLAAASCICMVAPTIVITLVLWVYGGPLIAFAFGSDFQPAWTALVVLSIGGVVSALGGISIALLHTAGKEAVVTRAFALSLAFSAGGSVWLAPQYGASGVAVAVLSGVVVRTAWLANASRQLVGVDPTLLGAMTTVFRRRT